MSVGQDAVLSADVARDREADIDEQPYLWSDLVARRCALGLRREDIATVLRIPLRVYLAQESAALPVDSYTVAELIAMHDFVAQETASMLAVRPSGAGTITLRAVADPGEFRSTYPHARTQRHGVTYPLGLQHVAVGRAAAELSRQGHDVEVHRGSDRADLTVRRLACGLLKTATAYLLDLTKKKYYRWESGVTAPPAGLLDELQAVDDFITATATELKTVAVGEMSTVFMLDNQRQFEAQYPQACTLRGGAPYPIRVHHVAAGRRAHHIGADATRIAVAGSTQPA